MDWGRIKIEVVFPPEDEKVIPKFALGKVLDLLPDTNSDLSHRVVLPSTVHDTPLTAGMRVSGDASFEMPAGRDLTMGDIVLKNFSILKPTEQA